MTAETLTRRRFPRMSSNAFEHPADRAALDALRKVPVLDKVVHKLVEFGWERYMRIHQEAIARARATGWDPELGEDD